MSSTWMRAPQRTLDELLLARVEDDARSEYLDVCGTKLSAEDVLLSANTIANVLIALHVQPGERVATLIENAPEAVLVWWGTIRAGAVSVPINTAYKGQYLEHQLADSGARVLVVMEEYLDRVARLFADGGRRRTRDRPLRDLTHIVVIPATVQAEDDDGDTTGGTGFDVVLDADRSDEARAALADVVMLDVHDWHDVLGGDAVDPGVRRDPSDLATFVYTGGTTGPSKGCMLSHNYHAALAEQIGICWKRTADDVVWTPLPLFHYNAIVTAVVGALLYGGRSAIYRKFSVSNFWPEMNRTGATVTSTLGTMAYLLAHDMDRDEMPRSGSAVANSSLRLIGAAPLPVEIDSILRERFGVDTFSGAYGLTEASLVSWQPPGVTNKANAAGVINTEYFDVRIFDDGDNELPASEEGEIVVRPRRPHVMFEGYWGRPEATVASMRNLWYHTGDIGKVDEDGYLFFVDRKADYLRRRGENISSFEVERVLMRHGGLADVAVHAVPSQVSEDDLKVTATVKEGASVTEEELFRWCIDELPYFALPRYIEFRSALPRSPVGRVLKRELRDEGVTDSTWDAEASGITYEKR